MKPTRFSLFPGWRGAGELEAGDFREDVVADDAVIAVGVFEADIGILEEVRLVGGIDDHAAAGFRPWDEIGYAGEVGDVVGIEGGGGAGESGSAEVRGGDDGEDVLDDIVGEFLAIHGADLLELELRVTRDLGAGDA
jgi:hypothetical protein